MYLDLVVCVCGIIACMDLCVVKEFNIEVFQVEAFNWQFCPFILR
jgi:hypothetical protein